MEDKIIHCSNIQVTQIFKVSHQVTVTLVTVSTKRWPRWSYNSPQPKRSGRSRSKRRQYSHTARDSVWLTDTWYVTISKVEGRKSGSCFGADSKQCVPQCTFVSGNDVNVVTNGQRRWSTDESPFIIDRNAIYNSSSTTVLISAFSPGLWSVDHKKYRHLSFYDK